MRATQLAGPVRTGLLGLLGPMGTAALHEMMFWSADVAYFLILGFSPSKFGFLCIFLDDKLVICTASNNSGGKELWLHTKARGFKIFVQMDYAMQVCRACVVE